MNVAINLVLLNVQPTYTKELQECGLHCKRSTLEMSIGGGNLTIQHCAEMGIYVALHAYNIRMFAKASIFTLFKRTIEAHFSTGDATILLLLDCRFFYQPIEKSKYDIF
ncbi:hypothetical protein K7432_002187 [Basidiobolus ranarum]|uniref:Uncharacterized protein n=1 Tax=Basidiobolus ranarum TaxID=34480 RepID=A0ABR2X1V5_9FUNG